MNAFDLAAGRAWAMSEEDLLSVMTIAAREGEGPQAVALRLGRPLDNTRTVDVRDGVAIVPLVGPIFRRAGLLTEVSGATSTETFAQEMQAAVDDPGVNAVIMDISSPGGEVSGVNEVANAIYAMRGTKPIVAYVSDMAASGAYWIASAADRIVMDATAAVGSIGAVARYIKQPDRPGVRITEIVSSQSPNKRMDPETDAGRAEMQREVDAIAQVFVDSIARNRSVRASTVLDRFGRGGKEIGAAAVKLGMADSLGSLESVLAELSGRSRPGVIGLVSTTERNADMANETAAPVDPVVVQAAGIQPDTITAAMIAIQFPTVADALRAEGRARAEAGSAQAIQEARETSAAAERARILGIHDVAIPGYEALANDAIATGKSPSDFAYGQALAQKKAGSKHLAALAADDKALPVVVQDTAPTVAPVRAEDPNLPLEDRAKVAWECSSDLRAEFAGNFAPYLAFRRADEDGRVRRFVKES